MKQYTYARWLQGGLILFQNLQDPFQQNNLAANPDYQSVVDNMEQKLQFWLNKVGDRFLTGEEHIKESGQFEEWQIRNEHFYGGHNNF